MYEAPRSMAPPDDDAHARELRGFGAIGVGAIVVIALGNALFVPLTGLLVLAWAWRSHTPWSAIGYVCPRWWVGEALAGLVLGGALKVVLKALILPLFGAPAVSPVYHFLQGNPAALPGMLYLIFAGSGFGEETFFRGFLFERLRRLLGGSAGANAAIVLVTAVLFGAAHYAHQGWPGVQQSFVTGLVFGGAYAWLGRLWPVMWAHVGFNLVAVAIIYFGLEEWVAHLVFP